MMFFNPFSSSPMDLDLTIKRVPRKKRMAIMLNYGKVNKEGRWHHISDNGKALCSSIHNIVIKARLLAPPKDICGHCENLVKYKEKVSQVKTVDKAINKHCLDGNIQKELWIQYYGRLNGSGYCHTCHKKLTYCQYKAKKLFDGPVCFNNYRPLCKHCFTTIGNMGIDTFKKKFYPQKLMEDIQPMELEWTNDRIIT